jgi:hypothetical protein
MEKTLGMVRDLSDGQEWIQRYRTYILVLCQPGTKRQAAQGAPVPLLPQRCMLRTVGVDLSRGLPPTDWKYDTICVFVDHLSKMTRIILEDAGPQSSLHNCSLPIIPHGCPSISW